MILKVRETEKEKEKAPRQRCLFQECVYNEPSTVTFETRFYINQLVLYWA